MVRFFINTISLSISNFFSFNWNTFSPLHFHYRKILPIIQILLKTLFLLWRYYLPKNTIFLLNPVKTHLYLHNAWLMVGTCLLKWIKLPPILTPVPIFNVYLFVLFLVLSICFASIMTMPRQGSDFLKRFV